MDLGNLKIKYILGSFVDEPDYPTIEDFEYLYWSWVADPNGAQQLDYRRGVVKDTEGFYFSYQFLLNNVCKGDKEKTDEFLNTLISSGRVINVKNSITYKITKFDY